MSKMNLIVTTTYEDVDKAFINGMVKALKQGGMSNEEAMNIRNGHHKRTTIDRFSGVAVTNEWKIEGDQHGTRDIEGSEGDQRAESGGHDSTEGRTSGHVPT